MEKAIRKFKIPVYLIIVGLVVVVAAAVGIYFLTNGDKEKEPARGTYVLVQSDKECYL